MATSAVDTTISIAKESAWGVTPANPVFQKTRITGESLTGGVTTVQSTELRPDRNVADLILVAAAAAGGINFELSYGTFDALIEAVMFGNWNGNSLTNGASANAKSFTIEKMFPSEAGQQIFRYAGMMVNSLTLTLGTDAIITGSVDFMGKGEDTDIAPITGATYTDATTSGVLNTTRDFASLSIAGDTQNYVQSMDMTISNNLRAQRAVANLQNIGVGTGMFTVTGSMTVYFKNRAIYGKFVNNDSVSVSFILGEEGGKQYKVTMPSVKFSSGQVFAGGLDADLMCTMQYQAIYSPDIDGTIRIERDFGVPPAPVAATGITLDVTSMSLAVGNTGTIIATVDPGNATDKGITWISGDEDIATVINGVVTGVAAGNTVITATTGSGSLMTTCSVTVA